VAFVGYPVRIPSQSAHPFRGNPATLAMDAAEGALAPRDSPFQQGHALPFGVFGNQQVVHAGEEIVHS